MNNYSELLKDPRWQERRLTIMNRDGFKCQKFLCDTKTLHVHHRYYLTGREPWDYPDNLLITLCLDCHKKEEECKDVVKDFIKALQYWGYYNTEIRDIANELIERKMKTKIQSNGAEQNIIHPVR